MTRILAIDYGKKRIGLAITDERKILALPLETVPAGKTLKEGAAHIKKAVSSYLIDKIVIGLPLLPNGQEGEMSLLVRKFGLELQETFSLPIAFFDERFTSTTAHRALGHLSRKKRTKAVDHTAALILLQDYLAKSNSFLE